MPKAIIPYTLIIVLLTFCNAFTVKAQQGFIKNEGQWDGSFEMRANIGSGLIYLEKGGITWLFYDSDSLNKLHHHHYLSTSLPIHVVKSRFLNANSNPIIETREKTSAYFNYFIGNNPAKWKSGLHAFKEVIYKDIYPKIDLQILYNEVGIKYNFIVKVGGNPADIQVEYEGADKLELSNNGFEITTSLGKMKEFPPYVYQEIDGEQTQIPSEFTLNGNVLGFKLNAKFKRRHNLIIDPILIFSTYSGSKADNFGFTATYDLDNNGYAGGTVYNFDFPTTAGAFQFAYNGGVNESPGGSGGFTYPARDCGIHKYNENGTQLLFGTFIGGAHNEQPHSMIVNSQNQLVVFGSTRSKDFPTSVSYLNNPNPNVFDYNIFITILNPTGTAIIGSTLIGGSGNDGINGDLTQGPVSSLPLLTNYADDFRGEVIVDEFDNIYVASSSNSNDFPIVNGFLTTYHAPQSGLVLKMKNDLTTIIWSSFIGGMGFDAAFGIALGTNNEVFVAGGTNNGFMFGPLNGHRSVMPNNQPDGFIIKINRETGVLMSGTLVGTTAYDQCFMVKTDRDGFPYVYGQTKGNFPVTGGVYSNPGASQFVAKYEKDLKSVLFSTVIGSGRSTTDVSPTAFLVDQCYNIYVSGWGGQSNTTSYGFNGGSTSGMPKSTDAYQENTDGSDVWVAVFSRNMGKLIYGTYFGGLSTSGPNGVTAQEHVDGGTSRFDERGVIYHSVCAGCGGQSLFPTSEGAYSRTNNSTNCNNALFKFDMDAQNKAPSVADTFFTILVDEVLTFTYFGTDPDEDDEIILTFDSELIGSSSGFINIVTSPSTDTVFANISWRPKCEHLTGDTIEIRVKVEDKGCPNSDSAFATIKILVLEPPLEISLENLCLDFLDKNANIIKWDAFQANKYFLKAYIIRRDPDSSLVLKQTLTNGQAGSFKEDASLDLRGENYCYFVVIENICGRNDTLGFKICSKEEFENPIVGTQIITVTVPDNKNVEVVWARSHEHDFRSYRLYKGANVLGQIAWKEIAEITNVEDTVYIDKTVDVSNHSFCYSLQVTDKCGHISDTSDFGCNIVLKGISERWYFDLNWNPYREWASGVNEYVLYRSVDTGSLRPIVALPNSSLKYRDGDLDYWWGGYYYQVHASQNFDTSQRFTATSSSNVIYLIQPPLLHVPNAFSPNGDGINDIWGFVPVFVKEFNIKVFNRWGEKVFDTDNKANQWDGTFMSDNPFDNVFIWVATYTGWDNNFYKQQGTVTILK